MVCGQVTQMRIYEIGYWGIRNKLACLAVTYLDAWLYVFTDLGLLEAINFKLFEMIIYGGRTFKWQQKRVYEIFSYIKVFVQYR